jgi:hypothetical protein
MPWGIKNVGITWVVAFYRKSDKNCVPNSNELIKEGWAKI